MPKTVYLKKCHFEEHGYTEDGEGCRRLMAGVLPRRPHLDACRKRMYDKLGKTEKGRTWMERANAKMDGCLEEKAIEDAGKESEDKSKRDRMSQKERKAVVLTSRRMQTWKTIKV